MQPYQPIRRYPPFGGVTAPKRPSDPSFYLLMAQLIVCSILLLFCWGLVRLHPQAAQGLAEQYKTLLQSRADFPVALDLSGAVQRYGKLRDDAVDAAAQWAADLLFPPEEETQPLSGAGGLLPWNSKPEYILPDSCTQLPLIFSASPAPPASGKVTSWYGRRLHPITGEQDFHRGMDIAAVSGAGIYAALPGQVSKIDRSAIYGNYIELNHGDGLYTIYSHCDSIIAQEGENLRRGELIALVGSTGVSTGPHVHFEVRKDGMYYDPAWALIGQGSNDGV